MFVKSKVTIPASCHLKDKMYYLTEKALIAIIYHTEVEVLNTRLADCEGLFEHTPRVSQLHRGPPGIKLRLGSILKCSEAAAAYTSPGSDPSAPRVSDLSNVSLKYTHRLILNVASTTYYPLITLSL